MLVANKEHYTHQLLSAAARHDRLELLVPAMQPTRLKPLIHTLAYKRLWAGFAIAEPPPDHMDPRPLHEPARHSPG